MSPSASSPESAPVLAFDVGAQTEQIFANISAVLEAAGIPEPTVVNSVQQSPMEGTSMLYSFDDAQVPERHELQSVDAVPLGRAAVRRRRSGVCDRRPRAAGDGDCF